VPFNRVVFSRQSVEWPTPTALYDQLHAEFNFTLDPCPLGGTENGLARLFTPWTGKRVFCNPPYDQIRSWLNRCKDTTLVVYLLPARTDTRWFHEICLPFAKEIRFIKGRLRFGEEVNPAPFPSMVVVFRKEEE
jgi:site-specific DNA-methyltransferase (adenine-specific)